MILNLRSLIPFASLSLLACAVPLEPMGAIKRSGGSYQVVNVDGSKNGSGSSDAFTAVVTKTITSTTTVLDNAPAAQTLTVTVTAESARSTTVISTVTSTAISTLTLEGCTKSYYDDGMWKPPYYTLVKVASTPTTSNTAASPSVTGATSLWSNSTQTQDKRRL